MRRAHRDGAVLLALDLVARILLADADEFVVGRLERNDNRHQTIVAQFIGVTRTEIYRGSAPVGLRPMFAPPCCRLERS